MTKQTRVSNANMMTFAEKLGRFSWGMFVPMCMVLAISILVLFAKIEPIWGGRNFDGLKQRLSKGVKRGFDSLPVHYE